MHMHNNSTVAMPLPVLECMPQQWKLQLPAIFFTFLLPLLALALATISFFSTKGDRLHLPPGPLLRLPVLPVLPVLGNLHQIMGALPTGAATGRCCCCGWARCGRRTVVVSSTEAAREVMKTHDADCCSRRDTPGTRRLSYGHKDLVCAPYGEYWREMLSMRRVEAAWYTREAETKQELA
uniref:Cytochrome P450 n=1 Tax=Setaria viridis TaxID=4556 RepID=A0A4U6SP39_SETVI|nr:4-hydroxyphenylacetaldehyde oxime monooxygenase-like [Setaria viridis]TKV90169.1 hypothetical protein SEVIR_9G010866v2 [Setaria viridis]